jgi:predicted small secreted protein
MVQFTVIMTVEVMVLEELVSQLVTFSLEFANVNLDGLDPIVEQQNLQKYYMVLYVALIVHLCGLIATVNGHGKDVRRAGRSITGQLI